MKEKEQPESGATEQSEPVAQLLRLAGTRPEVPEDIRGRVHSAVHKHWKNSIRSSRPRRTFLLASGAAAAAVVIYFLALQLTTFGIPSQRPIGVVQNISSNVRLNEGRKTHFLSKADVIQSGTVVESTKSGRILIGLIGGSMLRMDVDTRVRLVSESSFKLEKGAVYLDSGKRKAHLVLSTSAGTLRNQGTQFEARIHEGTLRVRVRDGSVLLERNGAPQRVVAGSELSVTTKGTYSLHKVPAYGPHWGWVSQISPGFQLEGTSLIQFLEWLKQETGWGYQFSDAAMRQTAEGIILHGSVSGLQPEQMPNVVLPICGLHFTVQDGVLKIESSRKAFHKS